MWAYLGGECDLAARRQGDGRLPGVVPDWDPRVERRTEAGTARARSPVFRGRELPLLPNPPVPPPSGQTRYFQNQYVIPDRYTPPVTEQYVRPTYAEVVRDRPAVREHVLTSAHVPVTHYPVTHVPVTAYEPKMTLPLYEAPPRVPSPPRVTRERRDQRVYDRARPRYTYEETRGRAPVRARDAQYSRYAPRDRPDSDWDDRRSPRRAPHRSYTPPRRVTYRLDGGSVRVDRARQRERRLPRRPSPRPRRDYSLSPSPSRPARRPRTGPTRRQPRARDGTDTNARSGRPPRPPPPRAARGRAAVRASRRRNRDLHAEDSDESPETIRRPADPVVGRLIRHFFKIIKTKHHLTNVTPSPDCPGPPRIAKMVESLSNFIKPAFPTANVTELIHANANNWGYTSLQIMREHYEALLSELIAQLPPFDPDWLQAFEVAQRWAKRAFSRYKPDLFQQCFDLIEAAYLQEETGQETQPPPPPAEGDWPQPQVVRAREPAVRNPVIVAAQVHPRLAPPPPPSSPPPRHRPPRPQSLSRSPSPPPSPRDAHNQGSSELMRVGQSPHTTPPLSSDPQVEVTSNGSVAIAADRVITTTATSPPAPISPSIQRVHTRVQIATVIDQVPQPGGLLPPLVQRTVRVSRRTSAAVLSESLYDDSIVPAPLPPRASTPRGDPLCVPPAVSDAPGSPELSRDALSEITRAERSALASFRSDTLARPRRSRDRYGVTTHISTDRKKQDWTLSITKSVLWVGDSNLNRMACHDYPCLQIDSFPGANFRTIAHVLETAVAHQLVTHLVISVGINNRRQKGRETAVRQLQAAVRAAKARFPHASLYIPVLNFSQSLPASEQEVLNTLNSYIRRNQNFIPPLPDSDFQTVQDDIHWTAETARRMRDHWLSHLNLPAQ